MKTVAAMVLAVLVAVPAGKCAATSCKVIPCSKAMSAENGLHQADDAAPPQINLPVGCDDDAATVP